MNERQTLLHAPSTTSAVGSSPWIKKPLSHAVSRSHFESIQTGNIPRRNVLDRHLTLFDLVSIGIGGTIGSGLFVLCGLVAHEFAGPASSLSWALSGLAALASGCCYAEMASRIPAAGSAYAYAFVAMGECPAFIAAICLSLEYVLTASAVSRSWADKLIHYLLQERTKLQLPRDGEYLVYLAPRENSTVSPLAFVISTGSILLLLNGIKESKAVTNFFTVVKCLLVAFMVIMALLFVQMENWTPFSPYGISGILRGSTATFFGYLGYDEVCCLAGEAQNPKKNLPFAILLTLGGVTILYVTAAIALTGMQSFVNISPVSGFPAAFASIGRPVISHICALGELLTLPVVIPLSIIGQPRLQYALAQDGLLPRWFAQIDEGGNLFNGTLVAGVMMVSMATCVEFTRLNDMISAAVLMALSMTDTSLILLWHGTSAGATGLAEKLLLCFHVSALVSCVAVTHLLGTYFGCFLSVLSPSIMCGSLLMFVQRCPKAMVFGDSREGNDGYFRTPMVPYWPCFGIVINYYLIAQLEFFGICAFLLVLLIGSFYYFVIAARHSVGNSGGWEQAEQAQVARQTATASNHCERRLSM